MSATSIPLEPASLGDDKQPAAGQPNSKMVSGASETTPGGHQSVKWEVVAETMGILPAQIIAGRLRSEGVPARAHQESAGQVHGLIIGKMGTGYVSVPDSFAEQAQEILKSDNPLDEDDPEM